MLLEIVAGGIGELCLRNKEKALDKLEQMFYTVPAVLTMDSSLL